VVLATLIIAVMLLIWNGSKFFHSLPLSDENFGPGIRLASTALTLNVALILFGWRRYVDLQHEAEMRAEHERRAVVLATTDAITGLYNRKGFADRAGQLCADAGECGQSLVVISFQVHRFKTVNDRFGHALGDIALQRFANHVNSMIRGCDLFGRVGGEEFVLVLPDTGDRAAMEAIERIRAGFAAAVPELGRDYRITASFGVAVLAGRHDTLADMMERADRALYASKMAGRDRITLAPPRLVSVASDRQSEFEYAAMPRRAAG